MSTGTSRSFTYVYIPQDEQRPIEEKSMAQYATENMRVDPLHEAMREHFERAAPRLDEQRLAELRLTFAFYQSQGLKFDRKIQDALSGKTMVERIPLVEGTRSNDFVGVSMYVDDQRDLKELGVNARATEIAQICGQEEEIRGDVFLTRAKDNRVHNPKRGKLRFKRMDFRLAEASRDADWIRSTNRRQPRPPPAQPPPSRPHPSQPPPSRPPPSRPPLTQSQERNMEELCKSLGFNVSISRTPPPGLMSNMFEDASESFKANGNAAFRRGDYEEAIREYGHAIDCSYGKGICNLAKNNRALAYIKAGKYREALEDCEAVLSAEPRNVKAFLRAAAATSELGNDDQAVSFLERALEVQPQNREAVEMLEKLRNGS